MARKTGKSRRGKAPAACDAERRMYPRKPADLKVFLQAFSGSELVFQATLPSRDISIGGIFLESEFFLKTGTRLQARFELEGADEPIEVEATVVRQERLDDGGGVRSGFALEFVQYFGNSKQLLASFFLAPRVRGFVERYLRENSGRRFRSDEDRLVDILVAWELHQQENRQQPLRP